MVLERDVFVLNDCRKWNQNRASIAIYLIGKLRDTSMIDELIKIITDENEANNPVYGPARTQVAGSEVNMFYFQLFTHSVAALIKLSQSHPGISGKISKALTEAVEDKEYIKRFMKPYSTVYPYEVFENINEIIHNFVYIGRN
jgi:hypothetical protein